MISLFQSRGVLGINARNLLYVKPFNPRKVVAFADDKMKTKAFLSARGIPTAKLFARIDTRRQLKNFDFSTLPDECVLKPNYGFGGEGIIILKGRKNGKFLVQGKVPISNEELQEHIEDILDGKFSVNSQLDSAFFEQILVSDNCFLPFRPAGLPDIRIIVFNLVPVMAMLRIPTAESGGKANIHLGGIGIGIDIARGETTYGAQYNAVLSQLPHGTSVAGMEIPHWQELLLIASKIQYITNIGYLAVDLTLDRELGPVLLEVNARAGLTVQTANLAPLRSRLERVAGLNVASPEKGVLLAQELFGEKPKERTRVEEDKSILSTREIIEISGDGSTFLESATLNAEQEETVFSSDLIQELQKGGALESVEGNARAFRVKFLLGKKKIQTLIREEKLVGVRVMIGRRDLQGFLIDPTKKAVEHNVFSGMRKDMRAVDRLVCSIDKRLPILKYVRPLNLEEELFRATEDERYNPVFIYRELPKEIGEMEISLRKIVTDTSPFGILLGKKVRETLYKIELLKARGNAERFTSASIALFGSPSAALIGYARTYLRTQEKAPLDALPDPVMKFTEAKEVLEEALKKYSLHDWQVVIKKSMVADCAVGEKKVFLREGGKLSTTRVQSLVAHEIETHAITAENGAAQPYEIFRRGFAHYLDTQEGLAIYNQLRILPPWHEKRFLHAKIVIGIEFALEHSFAETREYLRRELVLSKEKALMKAVDLKRGIARTEEKGAFTKSLVYFRGLRAVEQYIEAGGKVPDLYLGKIAIEDLELIRQIPDTRDPLILPYLSSEVAVKKPRKPQK